MNLTSVWTRDGRELQTNSLQAVDLIDGKSFFSEKPLSDAQNLALIKSNTDALIDALPEVQAWRNKLAPTFESYINSDGKRVPIEGTPLD